MLQVVTANRLVDGGVVYLTGDGRWSEWIGDGCLADGGQQTDALMETAEKAAAAHIVVAPYAIEVIIENGTVRARRYREHIRASGPTIRADLGKQAARG
jgi:hypothetical protein